MTSGTPIQGALVVRGRNRLSERFLAGFQDRQHLSGFAASRAIDAVEFLARMPAVDQPIEQVSLSHLSAASLPRPYRRRKDQWQLRRNLSIPLAEEISTRAVIPPEARCSTGLPVHSDWPEIF